jgi:broad-specificity NMP kinase
MKDFIFITGTSGIGKSTLAKGLLEHYKTTCVEQWMVPEFFSRDGVEEMTGELEELTCEYRKLKMIFLWRHES